MRLTSPDAHESVFSIETVSLGRIDSFPLTVGHFDKLAKSESHTSNAFMNSLIAAVSKTAEGDAIDRQDIAKLSDAERDVFAEKFLDNNQYLFREQVRERRQDENGDFVVSAREGEIKHERLQDESGSDYLFRLFRLQRAELRDTARRIFSPLHDSTKLKTNLVSPSFLEAVRQAQAVASPLRDIVERMRVQLPHTSRLGLTLPPMKRSLPTAVPGPKLEVPDFPPIRNPVHDTNEKLSDVLNALDSMEALAIQTAETLTSMDDAASQYLAAFAEASDKADRASRRMIWIGGLAILVAILIPIGNVVYFELHSSHTEASVAGAITTISEHIDAIAEAQRESTGQIRSDLNSGNTATTNSLDRLSTAVEDLTVFLRQQSIRASESSTSPPSR